MELVVARYTEDLAWLGNIPPQIRVSVYNKGGNESTPIAAHLTQLENIGREAHTYLHHIVTRYETLAPLSVFCQGKPFDHAFDFRKTMRELVAGRMEVADFLWLGHVADTDSPDGVLYKNWSKNETGEGIDLAGFHQALLGVKGPQEYPFFGGAQFVVTRERVRSRPLDFYQNALKLSVEFPHAAHCFERTWDRVFRAEASTRSRMGGEKTRYFKPIRRLQEVPENSNCGSQSDTGDMADDSQYGSDERN